MLIINALLLLRMSAYAYAYVQVKTSLKTLANEYTLLPTQMFPSLPARATFVADTKMFLILFRNILCPQQMFPSLRSPRNIMGNNVSSFGDSLDGLEFTSPTLPDPCDDKEGPT